MRQAITENRKTNTRRLSGLEAINQIPDAGWRFSPTGDGDWNFCRSTGYQLIAKPRYHAGEVVYRKEPWATEKQYDNLFPRAIPLTATIHFIDDGPGEWPINLEIGKLRSPMFLPEHFARYFIKIVEVRPERLQDITLQDIESEGITLGAGGGLDWTVEAKNDFKGLWDSINPRKPWKDNYWVWRYEFTKMGEHEPLA